MKYMMMMMKVQKKKGLRREFSSEGLLEYQKAYACRDEVAVRKGYKKGRWREHENSWKHIRLLYYFMVVIKTKTLKNKNLLLSNFLGGGKMWLSLVTREQQGVGFVKWVL